MRTSRRMLKQVRRALAVALAFSCCIQVLWLTAPVFALYVFQRIVPSGNLETLAVLALIVTAAGAAIAVLEGVRGTILLRAGLWLGHCMGAHITSDGLKRGALPADLLHDTRALERVRSFLTGGAMASLCDALGAPILVLALFVIHPAVGTIAAVASVLMIGTALLQIKLTNQLAQHASRAQGCTQQWLAGAAGTLSLASTLGLSDAATRLWERQNQTHVAAAYGLGTRTSALTAASHAIKFSAQTVLFAAGAWLIVNHQVTPAAIFAAAVLLARALSPLDQLSATLPGLLPAYRGYQRFKALPAGAAPSVVSGVAPHGVMTLSNVTYAHPGRTDAALINVSLAIEPGECLAITGPNGSGKSTLAAIFAGAIVPDNGTADLDGIAISKWQQSSVLPVVGYVAGEPMLLEGTVYDNIARFKDAEFNSVARASQTAGTYEVLAALSDGFDTMIGPGGSGLSVRERRAVALTRAVHGAPRVIVLDEPEAGLDSTSLRKLMAALRTLKEAGTSLVIATQDQRLIALADHVAVLNGGVLRTQSGGAGYRGPHAVYAARVAAALPGGL